MHRGILLIGLLVAISAGSATENSVGEHQQLPPNYVPSGKQIYKSYCAACHGPDGRGHGPAAESLKTPPSDLTKLSKRNNGKFPEAYVTTVVRFGPGLAAHGSSEMPVWGPIFQYLDRRNEAAVRQRIKNLCDFLASIQED